VGGGRGKTESRLPSGHSCKPRGEKERKENYKFKSRKGAANHPFRGKEEEGSRKAKKKHMEKKGRNRSFVPSTKKRR